ILHEGPILADSSLIHLCASCAFAVRRSRGANRLARASGPAARGRREHRRRDRGTMTTPESPDPPWGHGGGYVPVSPLLPTDPPRIGEFWLDARLHATPAGI